MRRVPHISVDVPDASLNTPEAGRALAVRVLNALDEGAEVHVALHEAERITPSYANTFVFLVAERCGCDAFEDRIHVEADERIVIAIEKSLDRFCRGIRLSSQSPVEL